MKTWIDRDKTLQELEASNWEDPIVTSQLDQTCLSLSRKPLKEFTVEDLRTMIERQLGLSFLVPLAIECLECNPFARGENHSGDLLLSVLRVNAEFWREHQQLLWQFQEVLISVMPALQTLQSEIIKFVNQESRFRRSEEN